MTRRPVNGRIKTRRLHERKGSGSQWFVLGGGGLLISPISTGTCVRVHVPAARVSRSVDKRDRAAAQWLLWERVTEPYPAET